MKVTTTLTVLLRFYDHPLHTSGARHRGCLSPKKPLSEREDRMARWGNPQHQMSPRPEICERRDPHLDCFPVQEQTFGHWCVNVFLEGGLGTLDLIIFCFSADYPFAKSFELIDGTVLMTVSKDTVPRLLTLDPRGIESCRHQAALTPRRCDVGKGFLHHKRLTGGIDNDNLTITCQILVGRISVIIEAFRSAKPSDAQKQFLRPTSERMTD